jgi:hypothetical protein
MSLRFSPPKWSAPAAVALLALAAAGCGDTYTWVGTAFDESGSESSIVGAITVTDGKVLAYTCGGPTTYPTHTHWFEGGVGPYNDITASSDEGWGMQGTVSDNQAWGNVFGPAGESFFFDAYPENDDLAGLYGVEDSGCLTGVIVWYSGGTEPRLQGTWCDDKGNFAQVTPVFPIEKTDQGIRVQVDLGPLGLGGVKDLYVTRDFLR